VDFEKAYDNINWSFLCRILKLKGFSDQVIDMIMSVMVDGKVCVKVNNELGPYFTTHPGPGVRQGDPLPSFSTLQ
jgi:hypothetical protein